VRAKANKLLLILVMAFRNRPRAESRLLICFCLFVSGSLYAQQAPGTGWEEEVRKSTIAQDWPHALQILDQEIALSPDDMDIRAWHARVLTWAGRLAEAEHEYGEVTKRVRNDPDVWLGIGEVYERQQRFVEALRVMDRAIELDPRRADLRSARARVFRATGELSEARLEFRKALSLDFSSAEARAGLLTVRGAPKHELRFGADGDLFDLASPNRGGWISLSSRWTPHWTTNVAGNFYDRGGVNAGKFVASVAGTLPRWGSLSVGGASGRDNGVIPSSETFFEFDHGFRLSEDRPVRGLELVYGQHWYWYSLARILTLSQTAIVYLPRDWTLSLVLTEARSRFPMLVADWKPSGGARVGFPVAAWRVRKIFGNISFGAGTEDFAQVDQIGRFSSKTYGGGVRFELTERQDVVGYASFQQRTQNHTDLNFGFSYGIRF
jgi:tetratricopeptide (TPR) repeat protein